MSLLLLNWSIVIMCIFPNTPFPCGRCYECLSRKRSDWSLRMQEQKEFSGNAFHAILTYDNEHLPRTKNRLPTVSKRDCQLFIKRLRHELSEFSYFLVAEYGSRTLRPHYHIVLFGVPNFPVDYLIYILEKHWHNGEVRRRSSFVKNDAQLHYVTKDLYNWLDPMDIAKHLEFLKKYKSPKLVENFHQSYESYFNFLDSLSYNDCERDEKLKKFDDRLPTFRLISKGLGRSWIDKQNYIPIQRQKEIVDSLDPIYEKVYHDGDISDYSLKIIGFRNLKFDSDRKVWIVPSEVANVRNFVEKIQYQKDFLTGKTRPLTKRFALPAYWRNKLFIPEFRFLINIFTSVKRLKKVQAYYEQYDEYDRTHDVPMYLEINREKWRHMYKSHKDKFLKDSFNFYYD